MTAPAAVHRLAPVGLDELNARAALTTRRDRKYLVPLDALASLLDLLGEGGRVLEIDGRRTFGYRTRYFDSPDLRCYLDTARRRPQRHKVRTRHYVDADAHWFEVKQRARTGITVKHRWPIAHDPDTLVGGLDELVVDTVGTSAVEPLAPRLVTTFERTTLLVGDGARLTFDVDVAFTDADSGATRRLEHAIVETKTPGRPSRADRGLWQLGFRPTKVSKYGTGLAAVRPDLPANRWARLLRSDAWAP